MIGDPLIFKASKNPNILLFIISLFLPLTFFLLSIKDSFSTLSSGILVGGFLLAPIISVPIAKYMINRDESLKPLIFVTIIPFIIFSLSGLLSVNSDFFYAILFGYLPSSNLLYVWGLHPSYTIISFDDLNNQKSLSITHYRWYGKHISHINIPYASKLRLYKPKSIRVPFLLRSHFIILEIINSETNSIQEIPIFSIHEKNFELLDKIKIIFGQSFQYLSLDGRIFNNSGVIDNLILSSLFDVKSNSEIDYVSSLTHSTSMDGHNSQSLQDSFHNSVIKAVNLFNIIKALISISFIFLLCSFAIFLSSAGVYAGVTNKWYGLIFSFSIIILICSIFLFYVLNKLLLIILIIFGKLHYFTDSESLNFYFQIWKIKKSFYNIPLLLNPFVQQKLDKTMTMNVNYSNLHISIQLGKYE